MFMHLFLSINRCLKTFNRRDDETSSEHNPTQSRAYSCNDLPCLLPLDGTNLVAVRGLTTKRYSSQERQWEELVGASLLRPIRTNRSSLTCRCQFPDSR